MRRKAASPFFQRQVTLSDVAAKAGVSRHTAGFVLAGKDTIFRPETVEAVRLAATTLGYRPSGIGQALRSGRSRTIGFIQDRYSYRTDLNRFLLGSVEQELADRGFQLIFASMSEEAQAPEVVNRILAEGFLVNYHAPPPPALANALIGARNPAIFLNTVLPASSISHDEYGAALALTTRCLQRWGTVGFIHRPPNTSTDQLAPPHHALVDRQQGYADACAAAGVAPMLLAIPFGAGMPALADQLIPQLRRSDRPRCVMVASGAGECTLAHLAAARCGLRVPEDVAFATFDRTVPEELGWSMPMALHDWPLMAREAVVMLVAAMAEPQAVPASRVVHMPQV